MPETYTAKQVASRIGTDAKTLRKFLRSKASPYDAVGQGGRYEFPKRDLTTIKKAFTAWQSGKRPSTVPATQPTPTPPSDPDSARRTREKEFTRTSGHATNHIFPVGEEVDENWLPGDDDPSEDDLTAIDDEDLDLEIDEEE